MLTIPNTSPAIVNVVGIDPGSETLGISVMTLDIETLIILKTVAWTVKGSKLGIKNNWTTEIHGDRFNRIHNHEQNLYNLFMSVQPLVVGAESPFYSRQHPSAYGALTEVITAIRNSLYNYSPFHPLYLIDPPTVKRGVGASGGAKKDEVRTKVLQIAELNYAGDIPIEELDEHSIDSIAVGYCMITDLRAKYKGSK